MKRVSLRFSDELDTVLENLCDEYGTSINGLLNSLILYADKNKPSLEGYIDYKSGIQNAKSFRIESIIKIFERHGYRFKSNGKSLYGVICPDGRKCIVSLCDRVLSRGEHREAVFKNPTVTRLIDKASRAGVMPVLACIIKDEGNIYFTISGIGYDWRIMGNPQFIVSTSRDGKGFVKVPTNNIDICRSGEIYTSNVIGVGLFNSVKKFLNSCDWEK